MGFFLGGKNSNNIFPFFWKEIEQQTIASLEMEPWSVRRKYAHSFAQSRLQKNVFYFQRKGCKERNFMTHYETVHKLLK